MDGWKRHRAHIPKSVPTGTGSRLWTIQNWRIQSDAVVPHNLGEGVPVIMGQGALNQGVSKIEIPDKSQMSGTKPKMALTTDKMSGVGS